MDANFWRQRWELNEIAFHEPEANPALVRHWSVLELQAGSRVNLEVDLIARYVERMTQWENEGESA